MLPKRRRLSAQEVREVLKRGRTIRLGTVSARYYRASDSKVAVVVKTGLVKRAVDRNRIRRLSYNALRALPQKTHLVLFIQKKEFDPAEITALCLKLF